MDDQNTEETEHGPASEPPANEPAGGHPAATEHTAFVVEDEELA